MSTTTIWIEKLGEGYERKQRYAKSQMLAGQEWSDMGDLRAEGEREDSLL